MSQATATATAARAGGAATQAIASAENSTTHWLREVIDGTGATPAQMVVTTVLGCIPYVGQALDARNIIIGLIDLSENPEDSELWLNLVLSLIALVPGFGDALKNVFKLLCLGKPLGRILDALPNKLRGNIEQWFRDLNWATYTRDLTALTDNILSKLIDLLDGWATRAVMGNSRVKQVVSQLEKVKSLAQQKVDEVMQRLQSSHKKALSDPLPNTTAAAPAAKKADKNAPPASEGSGHVQTSTGGTATPSNGQANGTHRQSPPKRDNATLGASGEHITDYYFVKRNKSRTKVSNHGELWEYQQSGHEGIDHVWHNSRLPYKYRVTDTKATEKSRHRLMTPKAFFEAARAGVDVFMHWDDEGSIRNATPKSTVGDGKELSHTWVVRKIGTSELVPEHRGALMRAIEQWERSFSKDASGTWRMSNKAPYDRSFVTVVGPNLDMHDKSKGGDLPRCSRPIKVHQIAAEFVLATEIYFE